MSRGWMILRDYLKRDSKGGDCCTDEIRRSILHKDFEQLLISILISYYILRLKIQDSGW